MNIDDSVYGNFRVTEPVLIDLLATKPLQRLKGIEQYGVPRDLYPFPGFSRYEHSVGVMLFLRKIGATLEEQIAGLIHDVSHTAFSHVFDWVMGTSEKEDYQDETHKSMLFKSEIPKVLLQYGFTAEKLADIKRYLLLERQLPDLCADRIDYSLREFYYWADKDAVKLCLDNIRRYHDKIVFSSKRSALVFGKDFLKCQTIHWGGAETVLRYYLFSEGLKIALSEKTISISDFYEDDNFIMGKLKGSRNPLIKDILRALSRKLRYTINKRNPKLRLKKKFRFVDPWYLEGGEIYRLSEHDLLFKKLLEEQRGINEEGINIDYVL